MTIIVFYNLIEIKYVLKDKYVSFQTNSVVPKYILKEIFDILKEEVKYVSLV